MRNQRGQVFVLVLLLLPLLVFLLACVADVALVVVTQARLQVAADQAALAAATSLAGTMDTMAQENRAVHREFQRLDRYLLQANKNSKKAAAVRIGQSQMAINRHVARMEALNRAGYERACDAASEEVTLTTPWATLVPLYGGARPACDASRQLFGLSNEMGTLSYSYTDEGRGFEDPGRVVEETVDILHHRSKPVGKDQQVAFGVRLMAPRPAGVLGGFVTQFDDAMDGGFLSASAAAQPFGASMTDGVMAEDDTIDAYDAELIALETLQDKAFGYQGRYYYDATDGWLADESEFLH